MLRDFNPADADTIDRLALSAFVQFKSKYADWQAMAQSVSRMSTLAEVGEIIVADTDAQIVGAVAYVGPDRPKATHFCQAWPIIRMLVVRPSARGRGLGRLLTEECLRRARRDQATTIALHTSPIMTVALPMYLRMGFTKFSDAPDICGVPYAVYTRQLA
jgi:GNAT superfamily N-acetyltransferase